MNAEISFQSGELRTATGLRPKGEIEKRWTEETGLVFSVQVDCGSEWDLLRPVLRREKFDETNLALGTISQPEGGQIRGSELGRGFS